MHDINTFWGLLSVSAAKVTFLLFCRRNKLNKYEEVGRIHSINLFPLKSGGPVQLENAKCTVTGLLWKEVRDRHWMVIRNDSAFLSARIEPKLVLIKTTINQNEIKLDAPGMPTLVLSKYPVISEKSKFIKCRVWDDTIVGLHCGNEAEKWIQKYLGYVGPSIVVTTDEMEKRDSSLAVKLNTNPAIAGDLAAFHDFTAYMIMSESSLDDLNNRLEKKVAMTNFRPNITISGCTPYDEDSWLEMRIGDTVYLRLLDLCARCGLTTVDPDKGVKDPKRQPLETLKSYRFRKEYDSPCFGVNAAVDIEGDIRVGDPVYVLRR